MGKIIEEVIEDTFVQRSTSLYDLSILVGVDSFFYLISDPQQNILVLKTYQYQEEVKDFERLKEPFQNVFLNDKLLQLPYHSTKIAFVNKKSTLVPTELYDANQKNSYLEQLLRFEESNTIEVNRLKSMDTTLVYAVDKILLDTTKNYFPNARVFHSFTPLILGYRTICDHQQGFHLFVHVKGRLIQTILFEGNQLQFCNSFEFRSIKDFIYYVMLVFDQFNLKPESTNLHLSGLIVENSEIYKHLYRYVRFIDYVQAPSFYRYGNNFKDLPKHFYYDLFCLKLCE